MRIAVTGELEILRTLRIEYGAKKLTVVISFRTIASTTSRTHLPALRRIVSTTHQVLRTLRTKHVRVTLV